MSRARPTIVPAWLLAIVLVAGCGGGKPTKALVYPEVFGSVGPGATISLRDNFGKAVVRLKPGKYTFRIVDRSSTDDFHLEGPTVDLRTAVRGKAVSVWSALVMNPGTYRFYSDAHPNALSGAFKVR